jgi:hypothetical protein
MFSKGVGQFSPRRRRRSGANLETKLLEATHMSRLEFFNLGVPKSVLRTAFSGMCGFHTNREHQLLVTYEPVEFEKSLV